MSQTGLHFDGNFTLSFIRSHFVGCVPTELFTEKTKHREFWREIETSRLASTIRTTKHSTRPASRSLEETPNDKGYDCWINRFANRDKQIDHCHSKMKHENGTLGTSHAECCTAQNDEDSSSWSRGKREGTTDAIEKAVFTACGGESGRDESITQACFML